ncbi:MAG TPA: hypothetical protein VF589_04890 [Allosphingosinicella sp.]
MGGFVSESYYEVHIELANGFHRLLQGMAAGNVAGTGLGALERPAALQANSAVIPAQAGAGDDRRSIPLLLPGQEQ